MNNIKASVTRARRLLLKDRSDQAIPNTLILVAKGSLHLVKVTHGVQVLPIVE